MMLRNRSRPVGSKQGLMSESSSSFPPPLLLSPASSNQPKHKPYLPRPFMAFSPTGFSDSDATTMSPTSILDIKHLGSSLLNPFFSDRSLKSPSSKSSTGISHVTGGSTPVGLGLVDALDTQEAEQDKHLKPESSRKIVFGSKLRIQIPSLHGNLDSSPNSPIEFGVKNRDAQLALLSPARRFLPSGPEIANTPPARFLVGSIPATELEMSEDYTCVISRGPNPRTTHIFDDCIVESCGSAFVSRKEEKIVGDCGGVLSDKFLSSCHACKKDLGEDDDIFMYRGEKAFCSSECRSQEMLVDESSGN